jgi:hypothetical protein
MFVSGIVIASVGGLLILPGAVFTGPYTGVPGAVFVVVGIPLAVVGSRPAPQPAAAPPQPAQAFPLLPEVASVPSRRVTFAWRF